eukprot:576048-Pyramimonas_sp.AAC.1
MSSDEFRCVSSPLPPPPPPPPPPLSLIVSQSASLIPPLCLRFLLLILTSPPCHPLHPPLRVLHFVLPSPFVFLPVILPFLFLPALLLLLLPVLLSSSLSSPRYI